MLAPASLGMLAHQNASGKSVPPDGDEEMWHCAGEESGNEQEAGATPPEAATEGGEEESGLSSSDDSEEAEVEEPLRQPGFRGPCAGCTAVSFILWFFAALCSGGCDWGFAWGVYEKGSTCCRGCLDDLGGSQARLSDILHQQSVLPLAFCTALQLFCNLLYLPLFRQTPVQQCSGLFASPTTAAYARRGFSGWALWSSAETGSRTVYRVCI